MGLFDFVSMLGTYDERKVDRFEKGDLIVDTCAVSDSEKPYETGIRHPSYNKGNYVIVELYSTKKKAKEGHKSWVKKMTAKNLPKVLKDVSTAKIAQLCDMARGGKKDWRAYKKKGGK